MSLRLGIDVGTSGVRTAVVAEDGRVVSMARAGHLAQDPDRIDAALWWDAVVACVRRQVDALREAGHDPREIAAVAVDGTSGSMVLTDAALRPVGRALMYNSKGFEAEAETIGRHAPDPHITRGGNSALARAMRLVVEAAEIDAAPAHLLHQADFIVARLIGRGGHSDHSNTLKTGFDPQTERWPDWIGAVFQSDLLPRVHAVGAPVAPLAPSVADELGLDRRAVVHAGTTDSIAAFFASAPPEPGVAVTSLGSTLAVKLLCPHRIDDPAIGLYSHRVGGCWLAGGASNTGGAVLAHFFTPDEMAQLSDRMQPASPTGLDFYPLLKPGERFPINDPALQPRLAPRPQSDAVFLQAMLEGIARIEARCYREIERRGGPYPRRIFSAGGGAGDDVFTQIRARALGLAPSASRHTEAAIGTALLMQR
ncbi:MAG: FGGY-family carbohydrate kinase [Pseudomonadota bacterium]